MKTITFENDFNKFRTEFGAKYELNTPENKKKLEDLVNKVLNVYKPEYRNKELFSLLREQYNKTYSGFIIYGKPKYLRNSLKETACRAAIIYMGIKFGIINH